jgi:hypothetical protein
MSKHTCECEESAGQSVGSKIIKHILCVKTNQSLVICIAEKLLPKLFWLSIIAGVILSFSVADSVAENDYSAFLIILSFVAALLFFIIAAVISFYTIYLLKALKDAIVCKDNEDSCGCKSHKTTEALNLSVSSNEAAPVKVRRKPGPKKGSKRGRKPKAVSVGQ